MLGAAAAVVGTLAVVATACLVAADVAAAGLFVVVAAATVGRAAAVFVRLGGFDAPRAIAAATAATPTAAAVAP